MNRYEEVNPKVVKVGLAQGREVLARRGAMLGYTGDVRFRPVSTGNGVGGMVGRVLSGESAPMMVAEGQGEVFYGFQGMHHTVIELNGSEPLTVEANRLMVHDANLQTAVISVAQAQSGGGGGGGLLNRARGAVASAMTGQGMFTTQITGSGSVVVLAHGGAIALSVSPDRPVMVDPQAFVAARGQVSTALSASMGFREMRGGEAFQLKITGTGTVWVQASETKF